MVQSYWFKELFLNELHSFYINLHFVEPPDQASKTPLLPYRTKLMKK